MKTLAVTAGFIVVLSVASAANAGGITGLAGFGYANATGGSNAWEGAGGILATLANPGLNVQLSGGYERFTGGGLSGDLVNVTSDFFWRGKVGAFGTTVSYNRPSIAGFHGNFESVGTFGEWYAANALTLRIKGGTSFGDLKGVYGGAGLALYPGRNLSLSANYDYLAIRGGGHVSSTGTSLEAIPYEPWPVSVAVSYSHASAGNYTGSGDTVGFAIKFRFGPSTNLRAWDRSGPTQWNGALSL